MTAVDYPHLRVDSKGEVYVGSSRYKVLHLAAEHFAHGWTAEELLRQHPDLRPEEIYAALTFFYDHRDELVAKLDASLASSEQARPLDQPSRAALLGRSES